MWYNNSGFDGIYYRNSYDDGDTWNPIKRITPINFNSYTPGIYVNALNVHIIWVDTRDGSDGEIYYRRSLDGGITWDNGQGVDANRRITFSPATISGIQIAGYGSNISVIWADERNGVFDIYWMISKDNGYTWEDGLGNVGQDRRLTFTGAQDPAIALNESSIHITCVDPASVSEYYLSYINSTDMGITWGEIPLLEGPQPALYHPDIEIEENDIHIVWVEGHTDIHPHYVMYKNSTDGGINWSDNLTLTYSLINETIAPIIGVHNNMKHVFWHNIFNSNKRDVFYKRYPDFPDTTPPSHSNETPPPDTYKDAPGTNVSVHVTDPSGVNESTIQLWINGSLVSPVLTPITDGYNVSWASGGFDPGVVTCRIIADDNLGNHLDYTWNFTVLALFEIQLHEGWNLISVPHVQVDRAINEVLKDIDGKWDYIQWYDPTDTDHWKSYATFKPESLNDLFEINRSMAIWINITEPDVNLTVRGIRSTYTEIPLYAGWNFVGYPTETTETVANALWGTGADRVEVYDGMAPYRISEVGPTYIMKPGEGYWVRVPVDTVWIVNW